MEPNEIQSSPAQPETPPTTSNTDKISQATGEFIHNNYETWTRKLFGYLFTILKFIRSTVMQIISQVFSR